MGKNIYDKEMTMQGLRRCFSGLCLLGFLTAIIGCSSSDDSGTGGGTANGVIAGKVVWDDTTVEETVTFADLYQDTTLVDHQKLTNDRFHFTGLSSGIYGIEVYDENDRYAASDTIRVSGDSTWVVVSEGEDESSSSGGINSSSSSGGEGPGWSSSSEKPSSSSVVKSSSSQMQSSSAETVLDTILIRPDASESQDADIYFSYDGGAPWVGPYGNKNSGYRRCASAGAYDGRTIYRTLIRFGLDSIPSSVEVVSADLVLTPQGWYEKNADSSVILYVYKLLKSWKEGVGNAGCTDAPVDVNSKEIDGVTAVDRYWTSDSSARWNSIGIALDDKDASSSFASKATIAYGGMDPVDFSITALVSSWVKDSTTNNGVLIRNGAEFAGPSSGNYQSYPRFHSGEATDASVRPLLRIVIKK